MSNGQADFFRNMLPYARRVSELTGIDPRLVLAQSALETGYGRSAPNFNFFGIKAPQGQGASLLTSEFENGQMVRRNEPFRTYASPAESFMDYANLMLNAPRYQPVREAQTLEDQIAAMAASGYATDPNYGNLLTNIASRINLDDPGLIASDVMTAIGRGPDLSQMTATGRPRPDMNGQPTPPGLLAQGAAPQRPRRDIGNILDQLAIGFAGMSLRPNQGIINLAQQRIGQRREERQTQQERNATADWLRSQGRNDLADGVLSGGITGAQAMQMVQRPSPIQVEGRLIDPTTFEVLYEAPAAAPDQAVIRAARTEFTGLPAVRSFADQTSAFGRVVASASDPSPAGDLALIFNYMKVLDPGSVVREGEFATAQNAGGIDERTRSLYNRLMSGERLTPAQREDFLDRSSRLYTQAEEQYTTLSDQYAGFARAAGLPVEQVIPDFRFTGEIPSTDVPPTPQGYTRQDWIDLWRGMTPEERTAFMEAGR